MNVQIPITIVPDAKGYFDRECPNPDCRYTFKIKLADWKEKVSDEEVHCPMCGHVASSEKWLTQEQLAEQKKIVQKWAENYAKQMLNKTFKEIAASTRHDKYVKFSYKPFRTISFRNNPIGQRKEWENEITCEQCGTQYSVIGSAYFCPCCGFNSVETAFDNSLNCIEKKLSALPEIKKTLEVNLGKDDAESICRSELEKTVGKIVSAFQNLACTLYNKLTGESAKPNEFQIVDRGSQLFDGKLGHSYLDFVTEAEYGFMNLMFQRRHIVEHNNGFVDQRYIDKSKDAAYAVGQRVVIRSRDVSRFIQIVRKLSAGLRAVK